MGLFYPRWLDSEKGRERERARYARAAKTFLGFKRLNNNEMRVMLKMDVPSK